MEHVAIDLGRPNSVMCQLNEEGKKSFRRFTLSRVNLDRFFCARPRCRVLIESSTESGWVARHLEGLGHEVVVADPNYAPMYGERNRRVKTDRRDAEVLFEANRLGIYREAHRRSQEQREVTALLRVRDSLVRTRTRSINLARALLRREGLRVRSGHAESFVAGALGLRLGGPVTYPHGTVEKPWMGEGTVEARSVDLYKACRLILTAGIVWAVLSVVVVVVLGV